MPKLEFIKMQGCGNDYIYVVGNKIRPSDPAALSIGFPIGASVLVAMD